MLKKGALSLTYFNHKSYTANSWWSRREFAAKWWQIYAGDPYWVPPYYPIFRRALEPRYNPYLARMTPLLIYSEALPRREPKPEPGSEWDTPIFEPPVAAAVALCDPRRRDGTAYLALLHCVNDAGSLKQLLDYTTESLRGSGCRKVIGPTGLSLHFGSGLLQDYWSDRPPLHTPYNPPYMPEVINTVLSIRSRCQLYRLEIPADLSAAPSGPAQLHPLDPARLTMDLLPLLVAACPRWLDFALPDAEEAAFLLRWVGHWPLFGWLAQIDTAPVGFVLLQPDLAPRLRRAKGGRNPLWRLWLTWAGRRPAQRGRVLFAGVLPEFRGQGIGGQLLRQAMLTARRQGWQSLSIGPLPGTASGGKFLEHHGAQPRQSYLIYQREL